jgi:hypothetical protein
MVQGLFFDWINTEATGAAIGREHDFTVFARTHETQAALALVQLAVARAEITLHPAVIECVPIARWRGQCISF